METKLYLLLYALVFVSTNVSSAIISLETNTGYPESYTHGAGVYAGDAWEDIDATCDSYYVDYAEVGSVSVSNLGCTVSSALSGEKGCLTKKCVRRQEGCYLSGLRYLPIEA